MLVLNAGAPVKSKGTDVLHTKWCSLENNTVIDSCDFYLLRAGVSGDQAVMFLPLGTLKNIN